MYSNIYVSTDLRRRVNDQIPPNPIRILYVYKWKKKNSWNFDGETENPPPTHPPVSTSMRKIIQNWLVHHLFTRVSTQVSGDVVPVLQSADDRHGDGEKTAHGQQHPRDRHNVDGVMARRHRGERKRVAPRTGARTDQSHDDDDDQIDSSGGGH